MFRAPLEVVPLGGERLPAPSAAYEEALDRVLRSFGVPAHLYAPAPPGYRPLTPDYSAVAAMAADDAPEWGPSPLRRTVYLLTLLGRLSRAGPRP